MRSPLTCLLVSVSLAALACSSTESGSGAPDPFVGMWSCTGTTTLTYSKPPLPVSTSTTSSSVKVTENGSQLTAQTTYDGGPPCAVTLTWSGSVANVLPGQTCTNADGYTATFTTGTATVGGNTMTTNYSFTFAGKAAGVDVTGTGTVGATCTRSG